MMVREREQKVHSIWSTVEHQHPNHLLSPLLDTQEIWIHNNYESHKTPQKVCKGLWLYMSIEHWSREFECSCFFVSWLLVVLYMVRYSLKSREKKDDAKMEKKSIQVPLRLKPILMLNSLVPFHYTDSSNPIDNWDMIFWVFSTSWQLGY